MSLRTSVRLIETMEEFRPALEHLPSHKLFKLADDGWGGEGGERGKCHKDPSLTEADGSDNKASLCREGWRFKIIIKKQSNYDHVWTQGLFYRAKILFEQQVMDAQISRCDLDKQIAVCSAFT